MNLDSQIREIRKQVSQLKLSLVEFKRKEKPYSHLSDQIDIAYNLEVLIENLSESIHSKP